MADPFVPFIVEQLEKYSTLRAMDRPFTGGSLHHVHVSPAARLTWIRRRTVCARTDPHS